MFRNTLTADDKYCFRDLEKLLSATQTEFSLKPKTFRHFFFFFFFLPFLESTSNFKHFEKKDDRHSSFITEITGCERLG